MTAPTSASLLPVVDIDGLLASEDEKQHERFEKDGVSGAKYWAGLHHEWIASLILSRSKWRDAAFAQRDQIAALEARAFALVEAGKFYIGAVDCREVTDPHHEELIEDALESLREALTKGQPS